MKHLTHGIDSINRILFIAHNKQINDKTVCYAISSENPDRYGFGYGCSNLISAMRLTRYNLGGIDFSNLDLSMVYFNGAPLNCYSVPITMKNHIVYVFQKKK